MISPILIEGLNQINQWGNTNIQAYFKILSNYFKESGSGLKWRYSGPPSVTSTFKGMSNVSCSFVACLDAP